MKNFQDVPRYTYWPHQAQFRHIGHKAVFQLNATKKVNIKWYLLGKNSSYLPISAMHGTEIPINGGTGISSKLTLNNLKINDTGSYFAVAKYRGGVKSESYTLLVFGE